MASDSFVRSGLFSLARVIYTIFIFLALPAILVRLWWRSLKLPAYRTRLLERFGVYTKFSPVANGILLHAVSVGELVAAVPLIKSLQKQYPDLPLTITTTTPTGSQRLRQIFGATVQHVYMPYDFPLALASLVKKVQPRCLIIIETELWPNLIATCYAKKIPVFIVNGRISERSFKNYSKFNWFTRAMLRMVSLVAAQSKLDASRFLELGLAKEKLYVTGNLKFDVQLNPSQEQLAIELKREFKTRLVLVAASTHAGEEDQILDAFKVIKTQYPQSLLILIPRHPDRFNDVAELLAAQQFKFVRRTDVQTYCPDIEVVLGDTMGELNIFYAAADVAFVGGSLINLGGHNLLEPAASGTPCLSGTCVTNFKDIADLLQQANALELVADADALAAMVIKLFGSPELRLAMGQRALDVVEKNRGAVVSIMGIIWPFLEQSRPVLSDGKL